MVKGEALPGAFGAGSGAGVGGDNDESGSIRRKDSGYSVRSTFGSEDDGVKAKARDFAVRVEKRECASTKPMKITNRYAVTILTAGNPIQVAKEFENRFV